MQANHSWLVLVAASVILDVLLPLLCCCAILIPSIGSATPEEFAELEAMPTVTMLTSEGERHSAHLKRIRSFFATDSGQLFHIHPELVDVDVESRAASMSLCEPCSRAVAQPSGRAATYSIAGGCDFGLLSRLGLEPSSALEALVLADVRTYSLTAKVHVPGQWCAARHVLKGHMIAFVHDGPSVVSQYFDEALWLTCS